MSFKPPRVDPKKTYVMKRVDKDEFVSQLTPMLDSPHIGNARRFDGKWLNDGTCWRWWTFHKPIEADEAVKLYAEPKLVKTVDQRLGRKGQKVVTIKALKDPKTKTHAKKLRRVLKAAAKRSRLRKR